MGRRRSADNDRTVAGLIAEVQTCLAGSQTGMHRWKCHECGATGGIDVDGAVVKCRMHQHLSEAHGLAPCGHPLESCMCELCECEACKRDG